MVADAAAAEQFGPYLVYERLGVGGMATVHRALERGIEGFERIVALKRLLPHLAEDASFIKSFVREAKLASLLNHVNVVQIFELGRVGTEYFISMEYIDGRDIRRILRHARKVTGPPPIHITTGLLLQLCDALDYAHTRVDDHGQPMGLVHRDVSPSNLLITQAGHLKVIDFGIAKAQSSQLRTQTGRVKGKLAYMAPEAVAGKDLDARSDLFAVGVIAHELLTARPLFARKNEYETLIKVQRGDVVPPSTFNQACPAELDAIVLKALAREPNDRFSSAAELRSALNELRRMYNLQTSHHDVAQWIDWAFSVEPPSGGFAVSNTLDQTLTGPSGEGGNTAPGKRTPTPLPLRRRDDEEAAVDLAWGGNDHEHDAQPVVLEDVPDVSDKHLGGAGAGAGVIAASRDSDDLYDDIPAPQPSHGRAPVRNRPSTRSTSPPASPATRATVLGAPGGSANAPGGSANAPDAAKRVTLPRVSPPGPLPSGAQPSGTLPPRITSAGLAPRPRPRTSSAPFRPASQAEDSAAEAAAAAAAEAAAAAAAAEVEEVAVAAPASAAETMRNLPSLPRSARMRAESVEPRELPSLDASVNEPPRARPAAPAYPGLATGAIGAAAAIEAAPSTIGDDGIDQIATLRRSRRPVTASVTIGAAIAARRSGRKTWLVLAALLVVGGAAAGYALYASRGRAKVAEEVAEPAPKPPVRTTGTVKFLTEPVDTEITVEGQPMHQGSPWALELPAGVHQISIHRSGYKAWLTSLELSGNETQTLRVVLEPLTGAAASSSDATLILSTTPSGLEVVLDGAALAQRTPLRMPLKPGPHTIVVRQNGTEVWRQDLTAQPSANYEFSPSMAAEKQRERAERWLPASGYRTASRAPLADPNRGRGSSSSGNPARSAEKPEPPTLPSIASNTPPEPPPAGGGSAPSSPSSPSSPSGSSTPAPPTTPPPATPAVTQPVTPPPAASGPVLVAPNDVTRLSGTIPTVAKSKRGEVPPVVSAKVCIDAAGRVSSVDVLTKLERMTAIDLTNALKGWTYAPYKKGGTPVPACFVVSLRVK
jgi:serine/threonine protein kinase